MRTINLTAVYMGLALLANGASGDAAADTAALLALRSGDMVKLNVHSAPMATPETVFLDASGGEKRLSDYRGQVVLVNFWATWCAPCRTEMPQLSALQTARGGPEFQVVTIATGRSAAPAITRFFAEIGVSNLPLFTDPQQALARDLGVMGLPVSVLLDREGREVGRLIGDADWSSPDALAFIDALTARPAG